jgi:hypothetical protein
MCYLYDGDRPMVPIYIHVDRKCYSTTLPCYANAGTSLDLSDFFPTPSWYSFLFSAFSWSRSIFETIFCNSSAPFGRNLVTLMIFLVVRSVSPLSLSRWFKTVFAVMANLISLGPSTNSRMAEGAWSGTLLRFKGSIRRTRVYPPGRFAYRSRRGPKSLGRSSSGV